MRRACRVAGLMLIAGLFAVLASHGNAATISLGPVADAFVSSANPANNYGGAGSLEVSAAGLAKGEFDSLLQFDLSSAKSSFDTAFGSGQWTVQDVSLQLTANFPNNAIFNASTAGQFAVNWMQNDGWQEGQGTPAAPSTTGITFDSLPSFLSAGEQSLGTFSFSGSTSATAIYPLKSASGILSDLEAGNLTSLLLKANDTTMSGLFNSRSFNTFGSRPMLTIDAVAVPEPTGWMLGALGAGAVAVVRRRFVKRS